MMASFQEDDENLSIRELEKDLTLFLGPYEPLIMKLQSLLVWENPYRSAIVFTIVHITFWLIFTTASRFFFLLSVFVMCIVFIDTWKNKIWPEIRVPPTEPEDNDGWTPVHPRLLSVPELSLYLSQFIHCFVKFFRSARRYRRSHPLVFCLGNTALFTFTALVGYYISGVMLLYLIFLTLMLWPSIHYHSMVRHFWGKLHPKFTGILSYYGNVRKTVTTFREKLNDLKSRFSKEKPAIEITDEDFVPQVDPDNSAALGITDSDDEGGNSSIPTPRLSKNPSFSTSEDEAPEVDFSLNINQMPSFDDLDNSDDELDLTSMNENNSTHSRRSLHFTASHFKESDSEDEESLNFSGSAAPASTSKPSGGPQFELASTLARTITSMIESAMQGVASLDQGQSASSSSLNPRTGSKITYTRTDRGESIDFLNPEPSISESDEDAEDEEEADHIAEIEKDFDFLSELDPEHD